MKKVKICFICSSGGHLMELRKLSGIANIYEAFLITEKVDKTKANFCKKEFFVKEINRKDRYLFIRLLFLFFRYLLYIFRHRPSVIISTGALCSVPMFYLAHFFGIKTIYIESFARVYDLSATGVKLYKFVDLFYVQWEELSKKYEKAIYVGSLFGNIRG